MGLNQLFNKDLVFCLHAKDQTDLFEQVASLLEERQIVTPTYRSALIEREKSFPTGLDMEFLGKDLPMWRSRTQTLSIISLRMWLWFVWINP